MNHAMRAVIALVLGAGLAATAQAAGTNVQGTAATTNTQAAMTPQTQPLSATKGKLSRQQIKQARLNRKAHMRLTSAHKQRMPRTATLHRKMLPANQGVGVGSSMPNSGSTILRGTGSNAAGGNETTNPNMNQ